MDSNRVSAARSLVLIALTAWASACGGSGAQPDDLRAGNAASSSTGAASGPSIGGGAASSPSINGGAASGPGISGGAAGGPSIDGGAGGPSLGAAPSAGDGGTTNLCYALSELGSVEECGCFTSAAAAQSLVGAGATPVASCDSDSQLCCCTTSAGCLCTAFSSQVESCDQVCQSASEIQTTCP